MPHQIVQYPVPLVLKEILKDKTDGELVVKGKNFTRNLFFNSGDLIYAKTDVIEERLGEILFKIGKINRSQFLNIKELIKNSGKRLGKILVEEKLLNQRDLFFALVYQFRSIATSTFSLVTGEWDFFNKAPNIPEDSKFSIGLPGIITEGTNKIGSISYFRNKFYYKAPKLSPIPESIHEVLSTYEINFYKSLGEHKNLSNEQIISKMNISEDIFWKKAVLFYLLNIIDFTEVAVVKENDTNIEEMIRLYEQLKSSSRNYYELLGIKETATFGEIKTAYFELAKKYHPDRISSAPDPEIKEKANFVFAEINKAYETLTNPHKRGEYDSKGYKEGSSQDGFHENLAEKARLLYLRAKAMYNQKKYWEASSIMDETVRLDPKKSSYFLLLGMSQMNLPKLKRMAANNLQKSIDLEPWNVDAFTAMGLLFMSENQLKRAEGFFRKVLSINPDHALARKKLAEITGTDEKKKSKFSFFGKSKK